MAFITTDNLTHIMAEMTDYCNAACPMCNRYDWDLNLVKGVTNKHHTTLKFIKEKIGDDIISRLKVWTCQGTYGDASMNPEASDIFQHLKNINPKINIHMYTNGGARNKEFWSLLANLKVSVTFSIDGLKDTNHLYRRNVKWNKLMENIDAFIGNGGSAFWEYLVFKHNQHQIEEARLLSKKLGFKKFSHSFSERWQDYNSDGDFRDITKLVVDDYVIQKPMKQKKDFVKQHGDLTLTKNKRPDKHNFFEKKIKCYACHDMKREIYLRANGYVSPCCILGDVERNEPKNIINDYKAINLHYTNLDTILKGKFFQTIKQGIDGGSQRLQGCYQSCGIN